MLSIENKEEVVYHTRTGVKYHRQRCFNLKSSIPIALKNAVKKFSACSSCNPPQLWPLPDISPVNSGESTLQDSKQSVIKSSNLSYKYEDKETQNNNKFPHTFGDISAIKLYNSGYDPLFGSDYPNTIWEASLFSKPFFIWNNSDKDLNKNEIKHDNKANFENARKIVKIIGAKENNEILLNDNNKLPIVNAEKAEKDQNEINPNSENIFKATDDDKIDESSKKVPEIPNREADLISKIKAIVEQKFAELESKLNSELEKLRKKTEQQESQIKALEEKNLQLEDEIAYLKTEAKKTLKEPNNLIKTENNETEKTINKNTKLKIEIPKEASILKEIEEQKILDDSINEKQKICDSKISEMENSLKSSFDKITKIEHTYNFQSDINKSYNEKHNFLFSESSESKF
jgi:hypothetical protein